MNRNGNLLPASPGRKYSEVLEQWTKEFHYRMCTFRENEIK